MITVFMLYIVSSVISVASCQKSGIINGSDLRSFSCLGITRTEEPCRVLGRAKELPGRLLTIYRNQTDKVKEALNIGVLTSLSADQLTSIHPVLLLLIPSSELGELEGDKLGLLLKKWSGDRPIIRHIISSAFHGPNKDGLLKTVREISFEDEVLDMIGEYLTFDLDYGKLLLLHLPFTQLLNIHHKKRNKMLLLLKARTKREKNEWSLKKRSVLRSWTSLLLNADYPKPLNLWNDAQIEMLGDLLVGAVPSELDKINQYIIADKFELFNFNFTTLQVRTLFQKFFNYKSDTTELGTKGFIRLKQVLGKLLPSQLQSFSPKLTKYISSKIYVSSKSTATSNQILQYLLLEISEKFRKHPNHRTVEDMLNDFGDMIYLFGPSKIKSLFDQPLRRNLQELVHLQSDYLSPAQVFYLTSKGNKIDVSSEELMNCFAYLHALPTSKIGDVLSATVALHLALHMPTDNQPRLIKFLSASHLADNPQIIIKILKRPNRLEILDNLSVRSISHHIDILISLFKSLDIDHPAWISLPNNLALSMYWSIMGNGEKSLIQNYDLLNNLIYGFTCNEINLLPNSDFIITISKYRKYIAMQNKEFPKNLQQCCSEKLVEYLKLKSHFTQKLLSESLINLLTPIEIEAVGGWILVKLSLDDFRKSDFKPEIIRQIGLMSVSELLVASDIHHLRNLTDIFLQDMKNKTINVEELYILGNLIMLSGVDIISKIDPSAFRILLERDVLDRRFCADERERNAWKNFIQKVFGVSSKWTGEELEILGDMMIALPERLLSEITDDAWIMVADVLDSKYLQPVQWLKDTSFYQVCQSHLSSAGMESYLKSIKSLITYYLKAAQMQLNAVKPAEYILDTYEDPTEMIIEESESSTESHLGNERNEGQPSLDSVSEESTNENEKSNLKHWNNDSEEDEEISTTTENNDEPVFNLTWDDDSAEDNDEVSTNTENNETEQSDHNNVGSTMENNDYENDQLVPNSNHNVEEREEIQNTDMTTSFGDSYNFTEMSTVISLFINNESFTSDYENDLTPEKSQSASIFDSLAEKSDVKSVTINPEIGEYDHLTETGSMSTPLENSGEISASKNEMLIMNPMNQPPTDYPYELSKNSGIDATEFTSALNSILKQLPEVKHIERSKQSDDPLLEPFLEEDKNKENGVNSLVKQIAANLVNYLGNVKKMRTEGYDNGTLMTDDDFLEIIPDGKTMSKRSLEINNNLVISCDAIRTVGIPASLVLTEQMIDLMTEEELADCTELFGIMDLSLDVKNSIWSRTEKNDFHLKKGLLEVATEFDLDDSVMNVTLPWALESINALAKYNSLPSMAKYVASNAELQSQLRPEEVVAFGKMLCSLPNLKERISRTYLSTIVGLGEAMPCDLPCLSILASLSVEPKAFGDPSLWSSVDVNDLGIIVAGLNEENWRILITNSSTALYGLKENAGACLTESHIKVIPETDITKIPYLTRVRMVQDLKFLTPEQKHNWVLQSQIELSEFEKHLHVESKSNLNFTPSCMTILFIYFLNLYVM